VADFIGQTNFLRGKLVQVNDTFATAHVPALNQDFEGLKVGELSIGDPVVVSVRPEKVHLSDREQIRTNSFYARVTQVAYIGSNTHVYIETDSGVKLTVWEQNKISTLDPLEYYEQGDKAWVTCFRENVLVLPETEA
jgi:spermidine/putrescine transport system ATP-binding protein